MKEINIHITEKTGKKEHNTCSDAMNATEKILSENNQFNKLKTENKYIFDWEILKKTVMNSHDKIQQAVATLLVEAEFTEKGLATRGDLTSMILISDKVVEDQKKLMDELTEFRLELESQLKSIESLMKTLSMQYTSDKLSNLKSLLVLLDKPENQEFLKEKIKK